MRLRVKEKYRPEVTKKFAALKDFGTEVDINTAFETARENINFQPMRAYIRY
jgi:hypothetical protein